MNSFVTIMLAGIMDGLTPCTFATMIFFLSCILFLCRTPQMVIIWGICFIIGVFTGLFFISFGVLENFRALAAFEIISHAVYLFLTLLGFCLGVVNIIDWWRCQKTEGPEKIILPFLIAHVSSDGTASSSQKQCLLKHLSFLAVYAVPALISGLSLVVISSMCIGQTYLPTMFEILTSGGFRLRGIAYIVIYNIFFIAPLLILFLITLLVVKSQKRIHLLNKHISMIKIILSAVYFGLSFGLIYLLK